MATWLTHLVLSSAGLLGAGLAAILAGRMLRRDPVTHYRVLVAVLLGALALPPLQLAVEGSLPVASSAAAAAPTAARPAPAEAAPAHPAGALVRAVAAVLLRPLSTAPDRAAPSARSSRLPLTSALL